MQKSPLYQNIKFLISELLLLLAINIKYIFVKKVRLHLFLHVTCISRITCIISNHSRFHCVPLIISQLLIKVYRDSQRRGDAEQIGETLEQGKTALISRVQYGNSVGRLRAGGGARLGARTREKSEVVTAESDVCIVA